MENRLWGITDWVDRARKAEYCIARLASNASMSPRRFEQLFCSAYGVCPRCWVRALRMQDAQRLLLEGRQPKEVASMLGYQHYPSFSRAFSRFVGCGPVAYVRYTLHHLVVWHAVPSISQNANAFSQNASRFHLGLPETSRMLFFNGNRFPMNSSLPGANPAAPVAPSGLRADDISSSLDSRDHQTTEPPH